MVPRKWLINARIEGDSTGEEASNIRTSKADLEVAKTGGVGGASTKVIVGMWCDKKISSLTLFSGKKKMVFAPKSMFAFQGAVKMSANPNVVVSITATAAYEEMNMLFVGASDGKIRMYTLDGNVQGETQESGPINCLFCANGWLFAGIGDPKQTSDKQQGVFPSFVKGKVDKSG